MTKDETDIMKKEEESKDQLDLDKGLVEEKKEEILTEEPKVEEEEKKEKPNVPPSPAPKPTPESEQEEKRKPGEAMTDPYKEVNPIMIRMGNKKVITHLQDSHRGLAQQTMAQNSQLKQTATELSLQIVRLEKKLVGVVDGLDEQTANMKDIIRDIQDFYEINGKFGQKWAIVPETGEIISLVQDNPNAPPKPELHESKRRKSKRPPKGKKKNK